ncbi:restriction endonuclease fold toxin 5 domain-containing protein [Archangium lipolyticum]|uniref:restriction endonuclease fold toxin 5 domain-containing protein n=1 Tax=Archangium lipolyticum TaxID=2970465 RepID=UPI00214A7FB2|nr:restriction endonuclease fold toxin 5 domain-containing protein [Archangium lipolyticum]
MSTRLVGAVLLALSVAVLLAGCATGRPRGGLTSGIGLHPRSTSFRYNSGPRQSVVTPSPEGATGSAGGLPEQTADPFQVIQEASGLEEEARHPTGAALYQEQARQLLELLAKTPETQRSFAPRRVLSWLLREVLEGGERVEYADLKWRADRFWLLVLVRPDGYLVAALTGTPIQRMGPLELVQGEWKVGGLRVGVFYFSRGGVFYPVTEALRRADSPPLAELGLGRDPLNAALDGAQDAMGEMVVALAQSILHPIRTVEDLAQLPNTVARLIASSPEYFARYGAMSREDQIREAARLSTHVLMMVGGAEATVGRIGGLGAELPVLSLTAEGEMVLGRAVVAGGTTTATVGMDLGALSILHMAGRGQGHTGGGRGQAAKATQTASAQAPGKWTYKKPTTKSKDALDYQEQVTGRPAWWVYMIGKLEFDGIKGRELLEAKGPGYCSFFNADGTPKYWYRISGGFKEMMEQARKQSEAARKLGLPLTWHVADAKVAKFLREIFEDEGWDNITVRHAPPVR